MCIKSQRYDVGKMKHYWIAFWQKCVFTFEPVPVPKVENRENFYLSTHLIRMACLLAPNKMNLILTTRFKVSPV